MAAEHDIWSLLPRPVTGFASTIAALLLTTFATLLGMGLQRWLAQQSVGLLYIMCVVAAAVGLGTWTGLTVAVLSFLAYNFFFIPPVFTFTIADPQELFALFVFLVVALLTGSLAGRMREMADAARRRAAALQSLNEFAAKLSGSRDEAGIYEALAHYAATSLDGEAVVLTVENDETRQAAMWPQAIDLGSADLQAAKRALRSREKEYPAAPGWVGSRAEWHPIAVGSKALAVLGFVPSAVRRVLSAEERAMIETLVQHAAVALERTDREHAVLRARDETERERLRSALLSSLSHDLRTPLASILGSVTSLRQLGSEMSQEARDDLLAAIEEEAGRMSRFVTNLLHMTRLEAGGIELTSDWVDVGDVVRTAVGRAKQLRPEPVIDVRLPARSPPLRGDATLLEHVVFNLIENSVKFTDGPAWIEVEVGVNAEEIVLTIADKGRGVQEGARERLFEPFFRGDSGARNIPGTGLGLAISKRIVEGMGGTIKLDSPVAHGSGTRVTIVLPVASRREGHAAGSDRD